MLFASVVLEVDERELLVRVYINISHCIFQSRKVL